MKKVFIITYTAVKFWAVPHDGGRVPEEERTEQFAETRQAMNRFKALTENSVEIRFSDGKVFREKRINDSLGVCNVTLDSSLVTNNK